MPPSPMSPTDDPAAPPPSSLASPPTGRRSALHDRLRAGRAVPLEAVLGFWPWITVAAVLLAVGWLFIKPAPPKRVVIAAGPTDGAYQWFAKKYAGTFAANGVTLEVRETAGSVENYRLFEAEANAGGSAWRDDGVSVAMVQSGTCPDKLKADLKAVASLYLEPVWIFYRGSATDQLPDLRGKRVAVGPVGSGTRSIAERLLTANRMTWDQDDDGVATPNAAPPTSQPSPNLAARGPVASDPATRPAIGLGAATNPPVGPPVAFWPQGGRVAADLLKAGKIDAAVFVFSPRHPMAAELLADPSVKLMSFARHAAYARIFPFLSDVMLPRGAVDLGKDLPPTDTYLLAPAANLVVRDGVHPAIVSLLIQAATAAHDRGDLLSPPHALPSTRYVEFPIDRAADEYFKHGPPFLQRVLPFSVAAFVDRMKVLLLPLITLLIPLARLAPPVYVWRTRSKIYRWYKLLREIDGRLRAATAVNAPVAGLTGVPSRDQFTEDLATLRDLERELAAQEVPLSYMQEVYNLRLHVDFLRRNVEQVLVEREPRAALGMAGA